MSASEIQSGDAVRLTRRTLLSHSVSAGTAALVPLVNACSSPAGPQAVADHAVFTAEESAILKAMTDRLIPADELSPAASDCGVLVYINRAVSNWNQADLPLLKGALAGLDNHTLGAFNTGFANLTGSQQDQILEQMEAGELDFPQAQAGFARILRLTLEGMFSDPWYGGNREYAGWDLIGYPGAVLASSSDMQKMGGRLPALHTSAYGADHDGH